MNHFIESMGFPFLACLVLTGIHVYLGVHIIARKVIFVDLALATIAALGAVWGALLGWDVHEDAWVIKGFSLVFTFIGAAVFSLTRGREERVPHEAIIGITYAVALAAMILGSAKLPHGAEEMRELQAGSILWVSGSTVGFSALLYAVIGLVHYRFRRQFFAVSRDPEAAAAGGLNVRYWDFLFYVTFGFVVTSSVAIAGILLVFAYLVIPSVIGVLFARTTGKRLALGWLVGTLVSALGVWLSYREDLPSGPVIVVTFGIVLALAGLLRFILDHASPLRGLTQALVGIALAVALVGGSLKLQKQEQHSLAHIFDAGSTGERIMALRAVLEQPELWSEIEPTARELLLQGDIEIQLNLLQAIEAGGRIEFLPEVKRLLGSPDDVLREQALGALIILDLQGSAEAFFLAASTEEDEFLKVDLAEALLEAGDLRGIPILLEVMDQGEAEMARQDACEHLQAHIPSSLSFHADPEYDGHEQEMRLFREWWAQQQGE